MGGDSLAAQMTAAGLLPSGCSLSVTQLDPVPLAPGLARRFVDSNLGGASMMQREAALLLTSELVTTVLLHARTSLELGVFLQDGNVVLAVRDHDPAEGESATKALRGRSKDLVVALADDHGTLAEPRRRTVWVLLRPHGRATTAGTLDLASARN